MICAMLHADSKHLGCRSKSPDSGRYGYCCGASTAPSRPIQGPLSTTTTGTCRHQPVYSAWPQRSTQSQSRTGWHPQPRRHGSGAIKLSSGAACHSPNSQDITHPTRKQWSGNANRQRRMPHPPRLLHPQQQQHRAPRHQGTCRVPPQPLRRAVRRNGCSLPWRAALVRRSMASLRSCKCAKCSDW